MADYCKTLEEKLKPSENAAQKDLGSDGNPPRRGNFPVRTVANSQFDDPTGSEARGSQVATANDGAQAGYLSAKLQSNVPSHDVQRSDLRNFRRAEEGRGRRSGKVG